MATLAIGAAPLQPIGRKRPLAVATENGLSTVKKVMERLRAGADPLDAAIEGIAEVEADPKDPSIGYGGLPNMAGRVELDALVMHGPTHGVGAVAALQDCLHPASVARAVMQKSPYCLISGGGATTFARSQGFPEFDLLTPETRRLWEIWKKAVRIDKRAPAATPDELKALEAGMVKFDWRGAMSCLTLDSHSNIAGVSSNPGRQFKYPGRVGDTPIPGAGLFLDNDIGACCSTGTGELNLMNCSCHLVIENLRRGMTPKDACLAACRRVVQTSKRNPRFRAQDGRLAGAVAFYCLTKAGKFGGAAIGNAQRMAVHDGESARLIDLAVLPLK
jgi:N4-(beta-N-acetylglucosaminyl)-L-asparaginase